MDEPCLQFFFSFQIIITHTLLAVGTFFPVGFLYFIATDMYIFVREEFNKFTIYILAEFYSRIFSGTNRRGEGRSPTGFIETRYTFIIAYGSQHMSRHIYFGNNVDTTHFGVCNYFFDIFLSIIAAIQCITFYNANLIFGNSHIGIVVRF